MTGQIKEAIENCEGCEFFKHSNKLEHCWRYTEEKSVCKLRQEFVEQPPAGEFTKEMRIEWHNMTCQIKPDKMPVSAELPNKLMRDLHKACKIIDTETQRADKAEAENCKVNDDLSSAILEYNILEAKLKAKDELLFAYESVNAPVNPLLSINKDLLEACEKYGRHGVVGGDICEKSKHSEYNCTCGFEAAIAKVKKEG